ncbi:MULTISPECIES: carbohydrate ABC transporter permease [Stappia]|uniref:Carbohydrate ABC transporter membrane protein 1, CUT1 family n=1 Tax=Stappia indica TaxID=538381 RepID=A0A285TLZ5_9HYPH|nr:MULTISPECIES: sugar ABC transporter permease [Stappia]MBC2859772.1 sugar ABC transporter permease [Stappia sp. 28M-7]MCC4246949.1 sugar ABC transporter permease [Stappia indica]SOC23716.1 carbohydrate ABC transporter membrane protein 1, CUT1 family [Stappia indica]
MTDTTVPDAGPTGRPLGRRVLPYAMLSPAVLVTLAIVFFPMVQTAWMSLHDYVLFRPNHFEFIGLDNFRKALADEVFWISLQHTAIWIGITIPAQVLLGLATALLLNQDFPWRPLARALIIIPWALPSVVIALMWVWIYDSNYGLMNDFLLRLGLIEQAVPWLARPDTALGAIILTLTWQGFPFFAVMILAGLQSIPRSYYEAAAIDGASTWRQFWHITLPGISGVLVTAILLRMIWVANSFDVIFVMTGGGPGYSTYTLPLYAFVKSRTNLDFGYGSALAVLFTLLLMVVVLVYLRRTGKAVSR